MTDQERIAELEGAIRGVVTQKADDVCWMDVYAMLGKLVGVEVTPESLAMLPTQKMLGNCERFIDSLKGGCPYDKDWATERISELERQLQEHRYEPMLMAKPVFASPRSPRWRSVRESHLKGHPICAACGSVRDVEVHHCKPYHLHPELELEPGNLITLCEGAVVNCHLLFGHLRNWSAYNPEVAADAAQWRMKIANRPTGA